MKGGGVLDFALPRELEASEPPEARGLARDGVRLMVSYGDDNQVEHGRFRDIGRYLNAGDLLVVNTSGTMNAALPARRADGALLELHLSTHLPDGCWTVELRTPRDEGGLLPYRSAAPNERFELPDGASVQLERPYGAAPAGAGVRLWTARLDLPCVLNVYLRRHGFPIRYGYVPRRWPVAQYQTVFATEIGSAEMPSAGRPFSTDLVTRLVSHGVQIAPLLLHTGVASLEDHEPPYAEHYRVPEATARAVNATHRAGARVIAVGTTVVRALETVTDADGQTHAGQGWTDLIITPSRGVRAVTGLLTGLHEPRASHLAMLAAIVDTAHLNIAYSQALQRRYLWHEFGDMHLLLAKRGADSERKRPR